MKIGILGGGQLAKMLALAGSPFDCRFVFYDPSPNCCAALLGEHIQAGYEDWSRLKKFAKSVDLVTYEFESVPLTTVLFIAEICTVYPKPNALEFTQDRWIEKQLFGRLNIPTAHFVDIKSRTDLTHASLRLGFPFILKRRSGGYDGKGQKLVTSETELEQTWLKIKGQPFIAEQRIDFSREVSLVAARSLSGECVYYDLAENHHNHGILQTTVNKPNDPMTKKAQTYTQRLMDELDYCGVLTLEFFQVGNELVANEYAPRVHNSGHWTIEGAAVNQFENHLRAILDLPLGKTSHLAYCAMVNFIGELPMMDTLLTIPDSHYHIYGKQPKKGRKLGHLTIRSQLPNESAALAGQVAIRLS